MGSLSNFESRQRLDLPDTPPELASPGASSLSSRSSPTREQAWIHRSTTSLPMSSYDKASGADILPDTGLRGFSRDQTDSNSHTSSRQQLPSLHSLFGPPSAMRGGHSSAERDTPHLAQSPRERSGASPSIGRGSRSYFPSVSSPPVSQPRSTYDTRHDPQSLIRSFSGHRSPKCLEQCRSRPDVRPGSESSKWPIYPDTGYTLGSRDALFQPLDDRPRTQLPTAKDLQRDYPGPQRVHSTLSAPPTPDSSAVSEGVPTKDGLGPKIWTGSHFLPRFVRATEVPGEGMCYFYDDGSHCKTVIDGEAVNAHWGVTKAGKPRKRLAIACITCREKKIKCDPEYPRCVQCEKFGRVCKFKNAPRGGHSNSPSTPPAEIDDQRNACTVSGRGDQDHPSSQSPSPISPRVMLREPLPETAQANKRVKLARDSSYATNGEPWSTGMPRPIDHSKSLNPTERAASETPRIPDDVLHRAWQTDPFLSDPQSISTVLSQFFGHIDNTIVIRFLQEDIYTSWVSSSVHQKGPEDMMLLYSVLAIGVALSGGPKHISYEYAQVANYAQKSLNTPCLQLVQSRILLAVYNIATYRLAEANELLSSAIATGVCLQLNQEIDYQRDIALKDLLIGMNRVGYAEARRRTFWSLFLLERLSPLFPARATMIHGEDIYVRLPSDTESFEKQVEVCMPVFSPHETSVRAFAERPSSITCHFIDMVHIWSSCQSTMDRLARRPISSDVEGPRIHNLKRRVLEWLTNLPSRLSFSGSNLESAAFSGKVGSFLTMHLLCHDAIILLNRYHLSVAELSAEKRASHFQECHNNARNIVDIICCLDRILRVRPSILSVPPPALATVGTTAVDVLTSTGSLGAISHTLNYMRVVKTAVDSTSHVWEHASICQQLLDQRSQNLYQIRDQGSRLISTEDFEVGTYPGEESEQRRWQIYRPLERLYPFEMDVIYCFPN
ncbi:hypothetical protein E4U60_007479 [Claviceps pazoutovae]|uniref:Zn(2)-C6 fungal-type domain-containing protein n=1 Tax=Claviceps pazoutovae TaxID=1649127 RepID=A0A9P7MFK7_9HYPO|nr:hypothetical protein E4U60_007479 [Claviceps pazoutovae]